MMDKPDSYVYIITALLPLAASMLIFQTNPYRALVIRGILGAIAALVYTVLGAADVALTEALVGTLLAITLYAVAVRSSMVIRLGVLKTDVSATEKTPTPFPTTPLPTSSILQLINRFNVIFSKRHLRVELVPYVDRQDLNRALMNKEVHAICAPREFDLHAPSTYGEPLPLYRTTTRLRRLYEILNNELGVPETYVTYVNPSASGEAQP